MSESRPKPSDAGTYQRKRDRARAESSRLVLAGQDIGAIPGPAEPFRRARADEDFRFFCESYFPKLFHLGWSDDHLRVIEKIERSVIHSEIFAVAMPRGSGKTTLCQIAVLWAILSGRHSFVYLIAAAEGAAVGMLENLKSHLSSNEALLEDYPEAVYPIRCLEGESRRCKGQRYYGVLTHIGWAADEIIFPTIPGSRCSGAIIRVAGITGNIRGANVVGADGVAKRPTLAVIDDPQTDESARSPSQVQQRLKILNGAVAGLAGPGKRIARVVPCTVIEADDLADQLLDREKNPEWQGERTKLIYQLPTNEKLWGEYARLRAESYRNGGAGEQATKFYKQNRAAMDEGARPAWPSRYDQGEVSATQHAMNLKLRDEAAFWAEYQNEPLVAEVSGPRILTTGEIQDKENGLKRGEIERSAGSLTAFIDVQQGLLWWMVCSWEDDFSGSVVDYGSFPDQKRGYFTLRDAKKTLQALYPTGGQESQIRAGLKDLSEQLLAREWERDDESRVKIDRLLIDSGWGLSTSTVENFCRHSPFAGVIMPSKGVYVGASTKPFSDYVRKKGERIGHYWRIPSVRGKNMVRRVDIDTNYWKSFVHSRLCVAPGDPGCLQLFKGADHRMIAEHLTAEFPIETHGRGRTVIEWKERPGRDNHYLDCLVGCAVAASMVGVKLEGATLAPTVRPPRKRRAAVSYL